MPAHEWRFRGLPGRADAIVAHHERRLAELLAAIRQRGPAPPPGSWPGELTWSRPWDQYSGQMRIFAVTQTAAHAHLLERRGLGDREPDPAAGVHGEGLMTGVTRRP